jgi:hypothetical protein
MPVLYLGLGLHLRLPKSPMGYIEMNLNIGITFRARYSYNLQYLHMYLFAPIKNLSLIFLIIK